MPRKKLDVMKEMQIHSLTDGPAKGWIHTHGLARHGKPELEIRMVPSMFFASAGRMLNEIGQYMLDSGRSIRPGDTMELGRTLLLMLEGKADEEGGYDGSHYRVPVLTVTALDHACEYCETKARA